MGAVLEVEGLHKRFGGIVVAEEVQLTLESGQILGLIGPNGAGKTSLFNLIAGVILPDGGSIRINGRRVDRLSAPKRARLGLARTWQHIRLFPSLTVLENLLIAPRLYPDEWPWSAFRPGQAGARSGLRQKALAQLERVRMADAANRRPAELSYGKQKLISLARALMNDGSCLLLDEPMAGVEGPAYEAIKTLVRSEAEAGRGVCVVEHNISFVRDLCSNAAFMFNGRIVATGSIEDMIRNPDLTELYFGT
jgi:branched-chain amino acid transport system ATP-binding protein